MKQKSTGDLSSELMSAPNIDTYLSDNAASFANQNVTQLITQLYQSKKLSKSMLARKAEVSEVYLHQVFSGRRTPSRDRLLCICIGMEATLDEIQELLKQIGYAQLYPRIRRDAIIIHGILHRKTLDNINEKLFDENEKTLW